MIRMAGQRRDRCVQRRDDARHAGRLATRARLGIRRARPRPATAELGVGPAMPVVERGHRLRAVHPRPAGPPGRVAGARTPRAALAAARCGALTRGRASGPRRRAARGWSSRRRVDLRSSAPRASSHRLGMAEGTPPAAGWAFRRLAPWTHVRSLRLDQGPRRPRRRVPRGRRHRRAVEPDYNVAPTKKIVAVVERHPRDAEGTPDPDTVERSLRVVRWGLVPVLGEGRQGRRADDQRSVGVGRGEARVPPRARRRGAA